MKHAINVPNPTLFAGIPQNVAARWIEYFYYTPRTPGQVATLRQRIFALYAPFADRAVFPAGIRYCVNIYVGCEHRCFYCYTRNYIVNMEHPCVKKRLLVQAQRDLQAMATLQLPPVPLHVSNSTDPFQVGLETQTRNTHSLMQLIAERREHFTSITFLTKNPALVADDSYLSLLKELMPCQVEVSLTFYDEAGRKFYEPHAPTVQSRLEGIQRLRAADIPVSLRIDPLFPREPLPTPPWQTSKLADYGVKKTHSLNEIQQLVWFAANQGCQKVIVSPLKVPIGSRSKSRLKDKFRLLYAAPFAGKPRIRGFSMRLPEDYIKKNLIAPVKDICQAAGIPIQHCRHNLITTL